MINELFAIYNRNFPFIVRADKTIYDILGNKNNIIIDKRNNKDELIVRRFYQKRKCGVMEDGISARKLGR